MKVAMISRSTLFSNPGGDTIQITKTANELNKLGVIADVKLCTEIIEYSQYDLLHLFNIIRPADILNHVKLAGKPFVVSTIFVDYSEYEKNARTGWKGRIAKILSADNAEYLKVILRRMLNGEKIISPDYILKGQRNSVRYILEKAAMLLPNSESEYKRLFTRYKIERPYRVIPNAIDDSIFKKSVELKDEKLVLCVSRIEGLKNQLNLIRALKGTDFKLHIIGSHSANHKKYYEQCRKEAGRNVQFSERMAQHELHGIYVRAKVHVLPSWFETTGLSSLEAAAMGCNIVITDKGDTREYFDDDAFYCQPDDVTSIRNAVESAAKASSNEGLSKRIFQNYTWTIAAQKTLAAYCKVLNQNGS
jgi:glycosyltransferase involved in cell wall biosynthesis